MSEYITLITNLGVATAYSFILLMFVLKRLSQAFDEIVKNLESMNKKFQEINEQVRINTELERELKLTLELLRRREYVEMATKDDKSG